MNFNFSLNNLIETTNEFHNSSYQYWIILNGKGQLTAEKSSLHFYPHDLLELPFDAPFTISCDSPVAVGCITLSDFLVTNTIFRVHSSHSTELIRKIFFFALDVQGMSHPYHSAIMGSVNQLMLESLMALGLTTENNNPAIASVIQNISENYTDSQLNLSAIIEETRYSKSHFRKLFRTAVGCSPVEFINNMRIEHAKKLIWEQHPNLTIKEIAYQSGFSDAYYFSRLFKKAEHITPTEYEQKVLDHASNLIDSVK